MPVPVEEEVPPTSNPIHRLKLVIERGPAQLSKDEVLALLDGLAIAQRRVLGMESLTHALIHESANLVHALELGETLGRDLPDVLPPDLLQVLTGIQDVAARAHTRLLALEMIFGARTPQQMETAPAQAVVEAVVQELSPAADRRSVDVNVGALPNIVTSRAMLSLVVRNLLDNAIGFCRSTVDIFGDESSQGWRLVVADDGPGIADFDRNRIFDWRARGVSGRPGQGIGLTIATLAADQVGEGLRLEPGAPTRFSVHLRDLR